MSAEKPSSKVRFDKRGNAVWEDDREPEMLYAGLSIADSARLKKGMRPADEPSRKRRTLDDMRKLSEHIKRTKVWKPGG